MDILKVREPDSKLVERISKRVQQMYMRFIREFEGSDLSKEVDRLISQGDLPEAVNVITDGFAESFEDIQEVVQESHKEYLLALAALLGVKIRYDLTSERLRDLIRSNRQTLTQRIVAAQRDAINSSVVDAYTGGRDVAKEIIGAIGLSGASNRAVGNYRESLKRQSKSGDSPMSEDEMGRMVEAYRNKMRKNRAETVAYTTAARVFSESQQLAVDEAVEQGVLDPSKVLRVWNRVADDRVRDAHNVMNGQTATMDGVFTDGVGNKLRYPGDPQAPPETTVNCRCWLSLKIQ